MDRVNCPHCNENLIVAVKSYSVIETTVDFSEVEKYIDSIGREDFRDGDMYDEFSCNSCNKDVSESIYR